MAEGTAPSEKIGKAWAFARSAGREHEQSNGRAAREVGLVTGYEERGSLQA